MIARSNTFASDYGALEEWFRRQAAVDGGVYVPNPVPLGHADYIFVCMEPSLGGWAGKGPETLADRALAAVEAGFLNFMFSYDDFILHHAAVAYLCRSGQTYHVTDVSKGAMTVKDANRDRRSRYERWLPLLRQELDLLSHPETRVIAVGKQVAAFLIEHDINPATTLLHYSSQAARSRNQFVETRMVEYGRFAETVGHGQVMKSFEQVTDHADLAPRFCREAEQRLNRTGMTRI